MKQLVIWVFLALLSIPGYGYVSSVKDFQREIGSRMDFKGMSRSGWNGTVSLVKDTEGDYYLLLDGKLYSSVEFCSARANVGYMLIGEGYRAAVVFDDPQYGTYFCLPTSETSTNAAIARMTGYYETGYLFQDFDGNRVISYTYDDYAMPCTKYRLQNRSKAASTYKNQRTIKKETARKEKERKEEEARIQRLKEKKEKDDWATRDFLDRLDHLLDEHEKLCNDKFLTILKKNFISDENHPATKEIFASVKNIEQAWKDFDSKSFWYISSYKEFLDISDINEKMFNAWLSNRRLPLPVKTDGKTDSIFRTDFKDAYKRLYATSWHRKKVEEIEKKVKNALTIKTAYPDREKRIKELGSNLEVRNTDNKTLPLIAFLEIWVPALVEKHNPFELRKVSKKDGRIGIFPNESFNDFYKELQSQWKLFQKGTVDVKQTLAKDKDLPKCRVIQASVDVFQGSDETTIGSWEQKCQYAAILHSRVIKAFNNLNLKLNDYVFKQYRQQILGFSQAEAGSVEGIYDIGDEMGNFFLNSYIKDVTGPLNVESPEYLQLKKTIKSMDFSAPEFAYLRDKTGNLDSSISEYFNRKNTSACRIESPDGNKILFTTHSHAKMDEEVNPLFAMLFKKPGGKNCLGIVDIK